MTSWKKVLECEGTFVWVQGDGSRASAVISKTPPTDRDRPTPLHTLMSQLDPTEWTVVGEDPAP